MFKYIQYKRDKKDSPSGNVISLLSNLDFAVEVEGAEILELEDPMTSPQPTVSGFNAYLRVNLETKELYYEYVSQESLESRIFTLQAQNKELTNAIMELTMLLAGTATD